MKARSALKNFILWVSLAIIVNIVIYITLGNEPALEFLGGYIIELSLSVDNLFLFLIIFTSFNIPISYQKRVLTYGIIGAVILRFIFIALLAAKEKMLSADKGCNLSIINTAHLISQNGLNIGIPKSQKNLYTSIIRRNHYAKQKRHSLFAVTLVALWLFYRLQKEQ